jgi:TrmH family RNA methyltransferase
MHDPPMTPTEMITSTANPRVKAAVRLRNRADRDETGLTIVDGAREILRAVDAGVVVDAAFVCQELLGSAEAQAAAGRVRALGVATDVDERVLAKLAFGDRSDGMVAVVRQPGADLAGLQLPAEPLIVVLEAVEKPGNLGAVLRSADGARVDALIAADARTDLFNPNAIRASIGTIFTVPVAAAPSPDVRDFLRSRRIRVVTARVDAPLRYTDADLSGPLAIVLGSEAEGLTGGWSGPDIEAVSLPMLGIADSLNVSVAAAVLLYEARRQRDRR